MKGLFQCPPWARSFCPFRAYWVISTVQVDFFFVIGGLEDGEIRLLGDYFRTSIAFFRPLSTAVGSF